MTALASFVKNAPIGFLQTKDVIEILKGLLMEEAHTPYCIDETVRLTLEIYDKMFNVTVQEQNAKIQAVIDKLEKEK